MLPRHTVNTFILDVVSLEYVVNLAMYQTHRGPLTSPKTAKLPSSSRSLLVLINSQRQVGQFFFAAFVERSGVFQRKTNEKERPAAN